MTTDPFTEAESAAAEKQWPRELISGHPLSGPERMNRRIGFTMGAEWARTHLAAEVRKAKAEAWDEAASHAERKSWITNFRADDLRTANPYEETP